MTAPLRILLIGEDSLLRRSLAEHLTGAGGMSVDEAEDGAGALALAAGHDLIVVDESEPLCRALREHGIAVPLLLLTAATASASADAIIAKPLRLGGLPQRLREAAARHCVAARRIGPWRFVSGRRRLEGDDGTGIRLTDKECAILDRLDAARGEVVAREVLLAEIWGYSADIATHTLETHIYRLRRKLEAGTAGECPLVSETGGYRLVVDGS